MELDPQLLYQALHDMRAEATERHIEVVERLTALEGLPSRVTELDQRVDKLEGWRNKVAGGLVAANIGLGALVTYLTKRH